MRIDFSNVIKNIFDHASEIICFFDEDGKLLYINRAGKELLEFEDNQGSIRDILPTYFTKDCDCEELVKSYEGKELNGYAYRKNHSCFSARINRPIDMDTFPAIVEEAVNKDSTPKGRRHILIVDDDPLYSKMVREWIKTDYDVDVVAAGMQAITFLMKNQVDIILLDYEMPIVDGPQVLQMLRSEPATENIPVIFLTGVSTREEVSRVMSLKPAGYVLKTTTREDLLKYLSNIS